MFMSVCVRCMCVCVCVCVWVCVGVYVGVGVGVCVCDVNVHECVCCRGLGNSSETLQAGVRLLQTSYSKQKSDNSKYRVLL